MEELKKTITCPNKNCNKTIRIPLDKRVIFTCPYCASKYETRNGNYFKKPSKIKARDINVITILLILFFIVFIAAYSRKDRDNQAEVVWSPSESNTGKNYAEEPATQSASSAGSNSIWVPERRVSDEIPTLIRRDTTKVKDVGERIKDIKDIIDLLKELVELWEKLSGEDILPEWDIYKYKENFTFRYEYASYYERQQMKIKLEQIIRDLKNYDGSTPFCTCRFRL
jgi:hypothetical protein